MEEGANEREHGSETSRLVIEDRIQPLSDLKRTCLLIAEEARGLLERAVSRSKYVLSFPRADDYETVRSGLLRERA